MYREYTWQRERVVEQTVQTAQTVVFSTERQITDLQTAQHTTEQNTEQGWKGGFLQGLGEDNQLAD